ncbi:MAG: hypothetical protein HUU06_05235 [Planctomycetaceae bacterium]|nr:hypothetical protein [Planctomycetota bacterium]NUN52176.1 hypothetical protein [Planctomycetaceae bacterium]
MEEYYILCPTRATPEPALISHLISRDICVRRQDENFHKCPTCVRSRIWAAAHPGQEAPPAEGAASGTAAPGGAPSA